MLNIIRFLRGFVRIRVTGFAPERFLNLCSVHDIELWDISVSENRYEMNLYVSDYFKLKPIVHKTRTKVVLLSKSGLPFFARRWKKRRIFLLGCLCCLLSLYLVSQFLWDIELTGGNRLTKEMLLQFLQEENVYYGTYTGQVDIDAVEKKLRDTYPFLTWVSLRVQGTRLYVSVRENDQLLLQEETEQRPCDLIATMDGEVESIVTRAGNPLVKAGDTVKKGDCLVQGEIPVYNDDETLKETMYVHADADICIRASIFYKRNLPFAYEKKVYTGEQKKVWYARIYTKSFSLGMLPSYEKYDIVTDLNQAGIGDFYLPLYYGTITCNAYTLENLIYDETTAKALLQLQFEKFCQTLQQKGIQIVENDVKIKKYKKGMKAEGSIRIRIMDGEERKIE